MNRETLALAQQLGDVLQRRAAKVTAAESCTGGGVAHAITAIPGSSNWFDCGFVTYADSAKMRLLAVDAALLASEGAVSEAVVVQMAKGALRAAGADFAVAVSGIAGPQGGSEQKPPGTVWFCWADAGGSRTIKHQLSGDRDSIREQAIVISLQQLLHQVAVYYTV